MWHDDHLSKVLARFYRDAIACGTSALAVRGAASR